MSDGKSVKVSATITSPIIPGPDNEDDNTQQEEN